MGPINPPSPSIIRGYQMEIIIEAVRMRNTGLVRGQVPLRYYLIARSCADLR